MGQKCQKLQINYKWPKLKRKKPYKLCNFCLLQIPKNYIETTKTSFVLVGVSNDQNLHFLWAKNLKKNLQNKSLFFVGLKCTPRSFGGVQWLKFAFFYGTEMPKTANKIKKMFLSQMLPKVNWRCPMTKICISFVGQKCQKLRKKDLQKCCLSPITKICILGGPKMPKIAPKNNNKNCFATNAPEKSFWVSSMIEICIFWGPNYAPCHY